jgi:hypothetical protein
MADILTRVHGLVPRPLTDAGANLRVNIGDALTHAMPRQNNNGVIPCDYSSIDQRERGTPKNRRKILYADVKEYDGVDGMEWLKEYDGVDDRELLGRDGAL